MGVYGAVTGRAVFLDRDGVINRTVVRGGKPYPPAGASELRILPGVPEAIGRLRDAGLRIIVVTNQPDVARGAQTREAIETINAELVASLPLDEIRTCFHDDADGCPCRKPKPGMFVQAAMEAGLNLKKSFMVGDRWRDIEAGRRAGCSTVFIDCGYDEQQPVGYDKRVKTLPEAAEWILRKIEGDNDEVDQRT